MLTYKDSDGAVRIEGCDEHNMEEMIHRCVDRLYEYEKLGLTPDGVRKALRELKALRKASASEEKTDCDSVVAAFNGICTALPAVKMLTDTRRRSIGTADIRLRKAEMSWEDFFRKVASSAFLCGKTGWKGCSFDWVIKPANMQKIIEGNYDDARGGAKPEARGSFDTDEFFGASMRRSYGEL